MKTGSKRFHRIWYVGYVYLFKTLQISKRILLAEQTAERKTNNTNQLVRIVQVRSVR